MRKDPINVQLISEPSVPLLRNIRSIKLPEGNNVDEYEGGMTYVTACNFW